MDNQQFDNLVRALAAGASRRQMLKAVSGIAVGLFPLARARFATARQDGGQLGVYRTRDIRAYIRCVERQLRNIQKAKKLSPQWYQDATALLEDLSNILMIAGPQINPLTFKQRLYFFLARHAFSTVPWFVGALQYCLPVGVKELVVQDCGDTLSDTQNCGVCGNVCGGGQLCVQGFCECVGSCDENYLDPVTCSCIPTGKKCPLGQTRCRGRCVANCTGGQILNTATCQCACPSGTALCDRACVQLGTPDNCLSCGDGCDDGNPCTLDTCDATLGCGHLPLNGDGCTVDGVSGTCVNGQCEIGCPNGLTNCDGECVDLNSNPNNCQGCGNVCPNGACGIFGNNFGCCPEGYDASCLGTWNYPDQHVCVDTNREPFACGGCGNVCWHDPETQAGITDCNNGSCCPSERPTACNGECVDLNTDPNNCTACGNVCASGACGWASTYTYGCCPEGSTTVCPRPGYDPNTLWCTNTNIDRENCGGCGNVCSSGGCFDGACCPPNKPFSCPSGCVDFRSDPANCGGCGNVCDTGICAGYIGGVCCSADYNAACYSDFHGTTICTDTRFDPANCGGCGNICASGYCLNSECCPDGTVQVCSVAGQVYCADTNNDPNNCQFCGNVCPSGVCSGAGTCCPEGTTACHGHCCGAGQTCLGSAGCQ